MKWHDSGIYGQIHTDLLLSVCNEIFHIETLETYLRRAWEQKFYARHIETQQYVLACLNADSRRIPT